MKKYDFVVIGGGFYGSWLALQLKKKSNSVLLIEKEKELLTKASYNNQARIHNGYHYPRSFLTALRSHHNYLKFIKDYKVGVYKNFKQYYAIASIFSRTTAQQFYKFSKQLGSPIKEAPESVKKLFDSNLIENVFEVEEIVFDAGILRREFESDLKKYGVRVLKGSEVIKVEDRENGIVCVLDSGKSILGGCIYNCTYAGINKILENSKLPLIPIKNEFIEMPLIKVPDALSNLSVTILDGPFFGILPFPDRKCHSLWHVRTAIRANWIDPAPKDLNKQLEKIMQSTKWNFMLKDMKRYMPSLENSSYLESLYETKTILIDTEESDGRPILFKKNYGINNFNIIMGGKIDNVYDLAHELKKTKSAF